MGRSQRSLSCHLQRSAHKSGGRAIATFGIFSETQRFGECSRHAIVSSSKWAGTQGYYTSTFGENAALAAIRAWYYDFQNRMIPLAR